MADNSTPDAKLVTGLHEARSLAGPKFVASLEQLEKSDPTIYKQLVERGFGVVLADSGITYREWALRAIGLLTVEGGDAEELDMWVDAAERHGATESEVLSVIYQFDQFGQRPRGTEALHHLEKRFHGPDGRRTTETIVQLSDHETLVRDSGHSGVPILLIHALGLDGNMFQKLAPLLVEGNGGTRVIAYDIRGHGYARGAPLTKSLEHLVSDIIEILDKFNLAEVDVVGVSYGGAVAQQLAIMHPQRVRALCPMSTFGKRTDEMDSNRPRVEAGGLPQLRIEVIMSWFLPETIAANTWGVRYARAKLDHISTPEWTGAWSALSKIDTLVQMKDLVCPVLVLAGSKDASATTEQTKAIHQAVVANGKRNSSYVEIAGGAHMMAMEMPEQVARALVKWRGVVDALSLRSVSAS